MKRLLLLLIGFVCLSAHPINMSVGQTTTLSISAPRYLDGCQWTISRPNDVIFTSTPEFYSTSVEIKAIHGFPASSPCVVQCKYYYKELDPVSGRYIYSRTGSQEWRIFVEDLPIQGSSEGSGNSKIELNIHSITIEQDNSGDLLYPLNYNGPAIKWEYDGNIALLYRSYTAPYTVETKGGAIGRTIIKCKNDYGGSDICEFNVLPKSSYAVGDDIELVNNEEVLTFKVLSNSPKTCKLYSTYNTVTQSYNSTKQSYLSLPDYPGNYKLTTIGQFTFFENKYMKRIVLPETVETIDDKAFMDCSSLEEIILPDNLQTIGDWAFHSNTNLRTIIFPKSLKTLGRFSFRGCQMENITLEEGLIEIGEGAFENVPAKQLIIPNTVQTIGNYAFNRPGPNPFPYESIICKIENPRPIPEYVFNGPTYEETILYVPYKSKSLYESTEGWKKFKRIEAYDSPDYLTLSSLEEAIDKAKMLTNKEYSESYIVDFEPTVTFVSGSNTYISEKGKYFLIYKDNLGILPGQTIKKGWKARLYNFNGLLELVPMEETEVLVGNTGIVPEPLRIYNAKDLNLDILSAVVYIPNVSFDISTPETRTTYTGTFQNQHFTFYNSYSLKTNPIGTYDIIATIGSYNGLQIQPIEFIRTNSVDEVNIDEPIEYYNLQGQRVKNPDERGIYIQKKGQRIDKVIISQ